MLNRFSIGLALILLLFGNSVFALGGDFTLTADDGTAYSLADSRGRVVVMSFGFTSCPDVCPTALATMAVALEDMGDQAENIDALFVSLDPDRDTPDLLREYTRYFHPRLRGLTGDAGALRQVAQQYRVRYAFVGKGKIDHYTLDHSANLFIIDPAGNLSRIVPHGLPPKVLADGMRHALRLGGPATPAQAPPFPTLTGTAVTHPTDRPGAIELD